MKLIDHYYYLKVFIEKKNKNLNIFVQPIDPSLHSESNIKLKCHRGNSLSHKDPPGYITVLYKN